MQSPCFKCDKRSISCHSECEDYLKFVKVNESRREKEYADKEIERYIGDKYIKSEIYRSRKKKRRC